MESRTWAKTESMNCDSWDGEEFLELRSLQKDETDSDPYFTWAERRMKRNGLFARGRAENSGGQFGVIEIFLTL